MKQNKLRGKRQGSWPLFWQITAVVAVVLVALLSLTLGLTLQSSLRSFQKTLDNNLTGTVVTLSESPVVRQSVEEGLCDPELMNYLDDVAEHSSGLDYITIAGADSRVIYHVDHDYIGWIYEGQDQNRALAGEAYFSDTVSAVGLVHRAFGPIHDEEGGIIGFIMAGTTQDLLVQMRRDVYITYIRLFAILMLCVLVVTGALVVFLKRHLRGVRSEDLLRIFLTQNDILNSLDEGLIAIDEYGRIRLVNQAAQRVLGMREELLLGKNVDEVIRTEQRTSLRNVTGQSLHASRPNIILNSIRLEGSSPWIRQALILIDKSELYRMTEQLGGTRHIISALRANNHEFLNKLQVISGLLQMGFVEEAQAFIGDISDAHKRGIGTVMQHIDNANVAALILGKMGNMRELGIDMTLLGNSRLPEHSRFLSTSELVTVVGNLLENALEAVDAGSGDGRSIVLQITEDDRSLVIIVSDSGTGIAPEDLPRIYIPGFSTKAKEGRGVGMALIREIVEKRGGSIDVDTDPGSGTSFALIFDKPRGDMT